MYKVAKDRIISFHSCHLMQLEEELQSDLIWSILIKKVLHSGRSKFQSMELAESGPFGKASILNCTQKDLEVHCAIMHHCCHQPSYLMSLILCCP